MSRVTAVPEGVDGVAGIVAQLNGLKAQYGRLPAIRSMALRIIAGLGNHDQAGQITKLAGFVRGAVRYVCDPLNLEYIQTPDAMLLEIARNGYVYGDCDDHALLFASLAESIGIPCDIAGVAAPGSVTYDHVIVVAHLEAGIVRRTRGRRQDPAAAGIRRQAD